MKKDQTQNSSRAIQRIGVIGAQATRGYQLIGTVGRSNGRSKSPCAIVLVTFSNVETDAGGRGSCRAARSMRVPNFTGSAGASPSQTQDKQNRARSFKTSVAGLASAFVAATLFSLTPLFAVDIITKKSDGKKINGQITAMTKTDLTLKQSKGEELVPVNDIDSIEWDGGGGELKVGYSDEKAGRYDKALDRFTKAKGDAKAPNPFLQGEYDYVLARVGAKQALTDADKRDQAIQKLIAVQKAYPDHIRFYESVLLLAQLQLLNKDFDGARATVDELKKASSNDLNLAALIAEAQVLGSEGKVDESIAAFEAAAKAAGNSPTEVARKNAALIGQARGLAARTRYEDALQIVESMTEKKGPVDDASLDAEAYVVKGQALRGLGRNKEAILAYLYVDFNYPNEAEPRAEALYHLTNLWKLDKQPDRSAEAADKLIQLYPKSEWRKKLAGNE